MIDPRLSMVRLGVDSLRRARRFYVEGLGWPEVDHPSDDTVFIQMPSMVLALSSHHVLIDDLGVTQRETTSGYSGISLAYAAISRDEVDELVDLAMAAAATPIKAVTESLSGTYGASFGDPDGHIWTVIHDPAMEPDVDGSFWMI